MTTLQDIKISFKDTIMWSKLTGVKIVLLKNSCVYNIETVSTQLMLNTDWIYHYYIPSTVYNQNFLLLGYKNDLSMSYFIANELKPAEIIFNIEEITEIFCLEFYKATLKYKNHSFHWLDQEYFATLLDNCDFSFVGLWPAHWGCPVENSKLIEYNSKKIYLEFLEINQLEDNLKSMFIFYCSNT